MSKVAADHNFAAAHLPRGICLECGCGVASYLREAEKYVQLLVDQACAQRQSNSGVSDTVSLEFGDGVETNLIEAVEYSKLPAGHHLAESQL
jgi:hypothetical protein